MRYIKRKNSLHLARVLIRREDLCNIECDNINLKDRTMLFYESKKSRNKTVDLPDEIVSLIHKFYNTLDKSERKKRKYLFDYVGRTAYRHFNHWCRVADIPERPIHALRATCIKFAHEAGWSDEAISKLTGDKIATIQAQLQHSCHQVPLEMRYSIIILSSMFRTNLPYGLI